MPTKYQGTSEETRALDTYIKLQRAAETTLAHTTAQAPQKHRKHLYRAQEHGETGRD